MYDREIVMDSLQKISKFIQKGIGLPKERLMPIFFNKSFL